jgi:hypothetical protein
MNTPLENVEDESGFALFRRCRMYLFVAINPTEAKGLG